MASAKKRQPPRRASGWQHYGAPAAFLLAATIAILLVRGSFGEHARSTATEAPRAATATTTATTATTARHVTTAKTTTAAAAGARYHDVQAGDTFGSIASRYGTTVAELEALNPGVSSTSLHIGQKIRVR